MKRRQASTSLGLLFLAGVAVAETENESSGMTDEELVPEQSADDSLVELLFVQEAGGVKFEDGKLILTDLNPHTQYFSDRPNDFAGLMTYQEYVDL